MHEIPLLRDIVVLLATALAVVLVAHRLRLPTVVAFLATGMLIGPYGLAFVSDTTRVGLLAEIGVVLLLFTVGLDLRFEALMRQRRHMLVAGGVQLAGTIAAVAAVVAVSGGSLRKGIFAGFLLALSSTAVVLKVLQERGEADSPHGRLATVVLIFQDFCLIPMLVVAPLLAPAVAGVAGGGPGGGLTGIVWSLAKAAAAVVVVVAGTRWLLPQLFRLVVATGLREVFTLTVILTSLGTAWLAWKFGLSLAIGAFLAGVVISGSEYAHQAVADILPLRDTFFGLFFIAMGMLFDVRLLPRSGATLAVLFAAILLGKCVIAAAGAWMATGSPRMGLTVGIVLAQVGEFSFVLAATGKRTGLVDAAEYDLFIGASTLSILAAPFLIKAAPAIGLRLAGLMRARLPAAGSGVAGAGDEASASVQVLIVGYGLNGQNLAQVLGATGIRYRILELDSALWERARREGRPAMYGDATRPEMLRAAGAHIARVVVVAISDPTATRRVTSAVRQLNPDGFLIVRTRYVAEIDGLLAQGASEVIPEEFETSVEIFARVLRQLHVPRNIIQVQVDLVRREGYGMMRGLRLASADTGQLAAILARSATDSFLVGPGAAAVGRTLRELDLRGSAGVTVLAVVRGDQSMTNPDPGLVVEAGDILVLFGSHAGIDKAGELLE